MIKEDDVAGIQIYPAQWPRKVLISLNNEVASETLLIAGLTIKEAHIDLTDENDKIVKVTMKDAMISWDEEKIKDLLSPYGKISRVENELIYINGKPTKWKSGTRFIYMSQIDKTIPQRLTTHDDEKEVSVSIWYKRPTEAVEKCYRCGDFHHFSDCKFVSKVCFICKGDHQIKDCPKNDGSRSNEEVYCFMTEKSPFSNFNMDFPVVIKGQAYNCNEQYIQSQKAKIFNDRESYDKIMASVDPREMKTCGKRISGYSDTVWKKQHSHQVVMDCVRTKVYNYDRMQELLLATGDRIIGEGQCWDSYSALVTSYLLLQQKVMQSVTYYFTI